MSENVRDFDFVIKTIEENQVYDVVDLIIEELIVLLIYVTVIILIVIAVGTTEHYFPTGFAEHKQHNFRLQGHSY